MMHVTLPRTEVMIYGVPCREYRQLKENSAGLGMIPGIKGYKSKGVSCSCSALHPRCPDTSRNLGASRKPSWR